MHPVEALRRVGGVADRPTLLRLTTRRRLRTALAQGTVVRVARNRYALTTADDGLTSAARLAGAASHLTAAAIHGWELPLSPERPQVVVPRNRKVALPRRRSVDVRWRAVSSGELQRGVTDPYRTVIDCARDLPFPHRLRG